MGNKEMDAQSAAVPVEKTTYSVIPYLGMEISEEIRNLILKNWMRTLKNTNAFFKLMEDQEFFSIYQNYIKQLLQRPKLIVRLAVATDNPDVIYGFSASEPGLLHYVWVYKDYRKIGIGRALIQFPFNYISHLTSVGMTIWNNKYPNVKFNPFK